MGPEIDVLVERLRDRRSGKVASVSHCLLNENTRYLGGACRAGCVREIVERLIDQDIGIVQMPCPEQVAWGGVLKRHLLRVYGHPRAARWAWIARGYSRLVFRRLARRVAAEIADYLASGFTVVEVIGVDGSPSCGVARTVDVGAALGDLARTDPATITVGTQNAIVRDHVVPGAGWFITELRRALARRGVTVPFSAHDLIAELGGAADPIRGGETSSAVGAEAFAPPVVGLATITVLSVSIAIQERNNPTRALPRAGSMQQLALNDRVETTTDKDGRQK